MCGRGIRTEDATAYVEAVGKSSKLRSFHFDVSDTKIVDLHPTNDPNSGSTKHPKQTGCPVLFQNAQKDVNIRLSEEPTFIY